jgi:abequosyltransferase
MKETKLLSICIPAYNRPNELVRLLNSIDCNPDFIEIVICEDFSPSRKTINERVNEFKALSPYIIKYNENETNLGYDANIRHLIDLATGDFVLFMGDDDRFAEGALDIFIGFLEENHTAGYVLRAYFSEHPDGTLEKFRYCKGARTFKPSVETCAWLFKRSVSIGGVTLNRNSAVRFATDKFDGTLLYQLYLVLEIAYLEKTVYSDIPVAIMAQTYRDNKPQFGNSVNEKRFEIGEVTPNNSIMFTKGFFEVAEAFDKKHGTKITELIRIDLSKYSYPFLSIQRKNGSIKYFSYTFRLVKETRLNKTWHFYLYFFALLFLGEHICDKIILQIKRIYGITPNL